MDAETRRSAHWITDRRGKSHMPAITDVLVNQQIYINATDNTVSVTTMSGSQTLETYDAFLVSGMSLDEFLNNKNAILEVTHQTKGRFAFINTSSEEKLHCHYISNAMYLAIRETELITRKQANMAQHEETKRQRIEFARKGGEVIKQKIREHYETIKPFINKILAENPDLSNHKIAKKLNEMGLASVNGKIWRYSNVENMREYFTNNPAYDKKGKKKVSLAPMVP